MSFHIVITTKGLAGLPQKIKRFKIGLLARMDKALGLIGQEVSSRSTEDYLSGPRPKKLGRVSGDLARSVNYKVTGNRVVIGSNLKYARIHELGGTIKAVNSPFLVFKIGKNWISKRSVVIPARPFLSPALKDSIPAARSIIQRMANEALREAMA